MKKFFLFALLILVVNGIFAQSETIDLQGIFKGKYRYDRVRSLTWRPQTTEYTFYNDGKDAIMSVDVKKESSPKNEKVLFEFSKLYGYALGKNSATKEDFNAAGGKVSTAWEWIDKNSKADDFDAFFEGEPRHCNISWTANTTILTILLQEFLKQPYIEKQTGCAAKSLVEQQFGKTANSDSNRLDNISKERIKLTLLILDINNPLPEPHGRNVAEEFDIQDAALKEIFAGQLRATKGI